MLNIMQNLSKRDPNQLALRKAIKAPAGHKVVAADSSQIEARMLAYIARQDDLVQTFRDRRDPYSEMAANFNVGMTAEEIKSGAKSGNKTAKVYRNVGKTAILSAGYGVGWKKFADTLIRQGTKLYDNIEQHYNMAQWCHTVYRQSVPQIVGLWKRCQGVVELLEAGQSGQFGGPNDNLFTFGPEPMMPGKTPVPTITMPSGFKLRYPELRVQVNDKGKPEYVYTRIRGKNKTAQRIYGSSLVENCTQGIAFQLLMWQACRMQEAGIQLKGNVHDSWYTIVPESEAEKTSELMQYWMSQTPPWLPDFPVACEAEIGDDFTVA